MNSIENGSIKLGNCDKSLRSIDEQNGIRCVGKPESIGEPIPAVDPAAYFNRLKAVGVEQFNALQITFRILDEVNDERLPISLRKSVAEAMRAAVEKLPRKRLVPIRQTQEIYSARRR